MLSGNALRHQMILPEQRAIYDYWRSKCQGSTLPTRDDISAVDLVEYLPTISLIELCDDNPECRFRFRLAGTDFYNIYKRELTGQYLNQLPQGSQCEYWSRVLTRVADQRRPSAGVVRSALSGKTHMAQFWIRLPLICKTPDGNGVTKIILGFDKFVKLSEIVTPDTSEQKIYA